MNADLMESFVEFCKELYGATPILLHRPVFGGNEKAYLDACIDSNFVSSAGEQVKEFEDSVASYTGAAFAVATVNGTSALQVSLSLAGLCPGDEVITQPLTFVATANAIVNAGGIPVFVDVDRDTLGLSPDALEKYLSDFGDMSEGEVRNRESGRRIVACLPMHTFGLPCRIEEIASICEKWGIALVEDAAEALGSFMGSKHLGMFGNLSALSFNGNKIITTGGGGMILTDDEQLANKARHLTTTAKIPHAYEYIHDEIGFNFRMPSINATLGCAQMEQLQYFLEEKKQVTRQYAEFFSDTGIEMVKPVENGIANNWLNAVVMDNKAQRDEFLLYTNSQGVMTRPAWKLISSLPMYEKCLKGRLDNSVWLADRIVNLPSSVPNIVDEAG